MKRALSTRELELVVLLSRGMSNIEIGRELHVSPHTVKAHLARIAPKLKTSSRAGIVGEAFRRGYLQMEEV